jgi:hypothetical protein
MYGIVYKSTEQSETLYVGRIPAYVISCLIIIITNNKLRGLSPQANYINRAKAACRRS